MRTNSFCSFSPKRDRRRGSAMILLTVMLAIVVVPMIGLAIDAGIGFLIKAKLSASVDASALAGARSLSVGLDLAAQTASAQGTINSFFQANFPDGSYRTSNLALTSSIQQTAYKTRTVTVNASVDAPLYFLRLLGHPTATITATSQADRRDVNVMMVLDRSGSMAAAGVCGTMKSAAQNFAAKFTNGRDRIGLITFMGSSSVDYPPTLDFKTTSPSLNDKLGQIACGGNTGSAQALWEAYQQLIAINEPGALNLIVFFTDGRPNGITADFPVKTQADTRYDSTSTSTLVATPVSGCKEASYVGFVAQGAAGAATGPTNGVVDHHAKSISSTYEPVVSAPGCAFASNETRVRRDIAFIPKRDLFGSSTLGYEPSDLYSGGPYDGQIRVDTPAGVVSASTNAADDAARRIRSDRIYSPVIYSIGLGGTGSEPLDQVFLRRVANDPLSPVFDSSIPAGLYVYAPDARQLSNAFNTVASQILRLAR